jgi:hypothetical protein
LSEAPRPTLSIVVLGAKTSDVVPTPDAEWRCAPLGDGYASAPQALAGALGACRGEFVLPIAPGTTLADKTLADLIAAANADPDVDVFILPLRGLPAGKGWSGHRCRGLMRNVENLRFAALYPLGAFAVRRETLGTALDDLAGSPRDGWWGWRLLKGLTISARIKHLSAKPVRRRDLLAGEPAQPAFLDPEILDPAPDDGRPRVLVFGKLDVTCSLYFDFLLGAADVRVQYRQRLRLSVDAPHFAHADLVVLVRALDRYWNEGVIAFLERAGVPFVYFWDDYFIVLRAEGFATRFFNAPRMRRALKAARALWASTAALAEASRDLHPDVVLWPPVFDPRLTAPPAPPTEPLTFAVVGGDFRLDGLRSRFIEALSAASARRPLRLLVRPSAVKALGDTGSGLAVETAAQQESFVQFLRTWRAKAPHIVLHPPGATAGKRYKCPTAAIVAAYLGTVPLVADEEAYADWGEADGVVRIGSDTSELQGALEAVADPRWRATMHARLTAALAARLCGAEQRRRLHAYAGPRSAEAQARRDGALKDRLWPLRVARLGVLHFLRDLGDHLRPLTRHIQSSVRGDDQD